MKAMFAALLIVLAAEAECYPQLGYQRIRPVDQAARDPSFFRFRAELLDAARSGNLDRVLSMTAADVRTNEDEFGAKQKLLDRWNLPGEPDGFLKALIEVLEGGGRLYDDGTFTAPYWFTEFEGDVEAMQLHVVIIQANVPVRVKPAPDAASIAAIDYAVLRFERGPPWYRVFLPDGRAGYVHASVARQPSGPHARFRKTNGIWMMVLFAAGMD